MKYNYRREPVSQGLRQAVNEKICRLIEYDEALDKGITKEDIFNLYTGDGGLHGLQASEYADYNAYKLAKQEIENGQFFTPPPVCEFIVQCLQIAATDTVADKTTPRLIQFHTLKNAVNPPFLGGFSIFNTVVA